MRRARASPQDRFDIRRTLRLRLARRLKSRLHNRSDCTMGPCVTFVHLHVLLKLVVRDEQPEAAEPVPEQRKHHEALSAPEHSMRTPSNIARRHSLDRMIRTTSNKQNTCAQV